MEPFIRLIWTLTRLDKMLKLKVIYRTPRAGAARRRSVFILIHKPKRNLETNAVKLQMLCLES